MTWTEATNHTNRRFVQVEYVTTWTAACYREWYEVWETMDGSPVTEEDIQAFKDQPRGQFHDAVNTSKGTVTLFCACDSGD